MELMRNVLNLISNRLILDANDSVKYLVLDEVDKLFELGLLEQTDEILAACVSKHLRKALFSATIPAGVEELARSVMTDPLRVIIGIKYSTSLEIHLNLGIPQPIQSLKNSRMRAQKMANYSHYDN